MANIFGEIPDNIDQEIFQELLQKDGVRIERILSKGHTSPETGWYDQDESEWVMVLAGVGLIRFEDNTEVTLETGDYLYIPKHKKHKVSWTDPDIPTVWLAIFFNA